MKIFNLNAAAKIFIWNYRFQIFEHWFYHDVWSIHIVLQTLVAKNYQTQKTTKVMYSITFSSTLKRQFDCSSCHTYFRRSFNFEKTGEVFANVFRSFLKSYPKIIRRPRGWLITDSMNVLHSLELSDSIGKHSISIRNICNKENVFIIVTHLR